MGITSPHGIVYGDEGDPPEFWTADQAQANSMEAALTAFEVWQPWTPLFAQGGQAGPTNWGVGGGIEGHYTQIGKLVHAEFRGQIGSSGHVWSAGTTVLTLPVPAFEFTIGTELQAAVGEWTIRDDSATRHYSGSIGIFGVSATSVSFGGCWDGANMVRVTEAVPVVWAANDIFSGNLTYRAA